ncbi:hypothetical protein NTE_00578 [Candidatus Nitrososphaera evergladensis SR1]|jgi:hypothetical protein|uniref:Uncharacterized protein n=1 Tax=Candidatus Nitrososphaera evergladensis SR1 TaxID=1459636 RepID=A0A075MTQ0_9ARCH|nr:hypothetical protein NTE_00578 [Candidatus Nitrososphaera evergladensis SR1]
MTIIIANRTCVILVMSTLVVQALLISAPRIARIVSFTFMAASHLILLFFPSSVFRMVIAETTYKTDWLVIIIL